MKFCEITNARTRQTIHAIHMQISAGYSAVLVISTHLYLKRMHASAKNGSDMARNIHE